jgi:hypothetical protein
VFHVSSPADNFGRIDPEVKRDARLFYSSQLSAQVSRDSAKKLDLGDAEFVTRWQRVAPNQVAVEYEHTAFGWELDAGCPLEPRDTRRGKTPAFKSKFRFERQLIS